VGSPADEEEDELRSPGVKRMAVEVHWKRL
jgi:hypothetical protein